MLSGKNYRKRGASLLSTLIPLCALCLAAGSRPAAGAELGGDGPVHLSADTLTFDVPSQMYEAAGSVRVLRDGTALSADRLTYKSSTEDASAEGDVRLERGDDILRGDRLWLNLGTKRGELTKGDLFVKKSKFRIKGEHLSKTGEADYHLDRGSFTTCEGDHPSWRFEARDVNVTLDEYATAKGAVFYAGNVPLLYTPYLIFPVLRERSTGLLIPKVGRSTKKGFFLLQPFYWNISPSQDLTVNLDLQSERGAGTGFEYRYMRQRGSEGTLSAKGIYDTNQERFRGEVKQKHLENFSPNTTLSSDIEVVTDREYYRDFGEDPGEYNKQLHESSIAFTHRWERYGVFGALRYVQSLQPSENVTVDNTTTLQRLPVVNFIGAGEKAGPFYFSLDSAVTHFERDNGVTGERLEVHPKLSYYGRPARLFDLSLFGGYHQRFYNTYAGDVTSGQGEGEADAGGSLSLPLAKVYGEKVRHLLTPGLEFRFVQQKFQEDLPFFDFGDRVLGQRILNWSLTNVFTGKFVEDGVPSFRELVFLKISQGYQFTGERRDLLTLVDRNHHLTDLMLEGRVTPIKQVTLEVGSRYNPVDNILSSGNVALDARGEGGVQAIFGYRYSREQVNYLEGLFGFPLGKPFFATVLGRYSFDGGGFLESRYALEYRRQCWSIIATYTDRTGNREFMVNFTLAGMGVGPVKAL